MYLCLMVKDFFILIKANIPCIFYYRKTHLNNQQHMTALDLLKNVYSLLFLLLNVIMQTVPKSPKGRGLWTTFWRWLFAYSFSLCCQIFYIICDSSYLVSFSYFISEYIKSYKMAWLSISSCYSITLQKLVGSIWSSVYLTMDGKSVTGCILETVKDLSEK